MLATDTNTARLEAAEDVLDELDERIAAQHQARTDHIHDRLGGDPAKLMEDRPSQTWSIASNEAEDEHALGLADEARNAISIIRQTLDRVGPPEDGLFEESKSALGALTTYLNAVDGDVNEDQDQDEDEDEVEED